MYLVKIISININVRENLINDNRETFKSKFKFNHALLQFLSFISLLTIVSNLHAFSLI